MSERYWWLVITRYGMHSMGVILWIFSCPVFRLNWKWSHLLILLVSEKIKKHFSVFSWRIISLSNHCTYELFTAKGSFGKPANGILWNKYKTIGTWHLMGGSIFAHIEIRNILWVWKEMNAVICTHWTSFLDTWESLWFLKWTKIIKEIKSRSVIIDISWNLRFLRFHWHCHQSTSKLQPLEGIQGQRGTFFHERFHACTWKIS